MFAHKSQKKVFERSIEENSDKNNTKYSLHEAFNTKRSENILCYIEFLAAANVAV